MLIAREFLPVLPYNEPMESPLTVYAFLKRQRNEGFCDNCIATHTGINGRDVEMIASALSLFPVEFTRTDGICPQNCTDREQPITMAIA